MPITLSVCNSTPFTGIFKHANEARATIVGIDLNESWAYTACTPGETFIFYKSIHGTFFPVACSPGGQLTADKRGNKGPSAASTGGDDTVDRGICKWQRGAQVMTAALQ